MRVGSNPPELCRSPPVGSGTLAPPESRKISFDNSKPDDQIADDISVKETGSSFVSGSSRPGGHARRYSHRHQGRHQGTHLKTRVLRRTVSDPIGLLDSRDVIGINPIHNDVKTGVGQVGSLGKSKHKKSRKKKKGEITQEHEQYVITYCMMLGIRFSVSRQSPVKTNVKEVGVDSTRRRLTIDEFMHVDKLDFDPSGSPKTPAHRCSRFKFKDYAPEVFRQLRTSYGINDMDYMLSLCGKYNFIEFVSNSKSGQFFFYSNDGQYLIKTQSKSESKFLRQILPRYYMYMLDNPDTLVVRVCGMHRVKLAHLRDDMHFVILKSVYSNAASKKIHTVYDLKGSTIGRIARPGEAVFKDLDLINNKQVFKLGPLKAKFLEQLEKDAMFLAKLHIMDYSLLVGIHNKLAPSLAKSIDKLTGQSSRTLAQQSSIRRMSAEAASPRNGRMRNNKAPRKFHSVSLDDASHQNAKANEHIEPGSSDTENHNGAEVVPDTSLGKRKVNHVRFSAVEETIQPAPSQHIHTCKNGTNDTAYCFACCKTLESSQGFPEGTRHLQTRTERHRALNLDDMDAYYSDEDEEEAPVQSQMFSPVEAVNENGKPATEIYYFGVIDILQLYNSKKRAETAFKTIVERSTSRISSISPNRYAKRFVEFIRKHVE
uniref:PIPK domain-containing protein n=1 Tax=Mucochytrium quahogii TaxID=96639 RepID=A0A7S2RY06_9STRA|mmetsp:Transcript_6981/g.11068  ORF Transcript_6981/g.11068 Transcript_6981/m.11068 type:complete len:655 (-) Transcript_6981:708-2672(-)